LTNINKQLSKIKDHILPEEWGLSKKNRVFLHTKPNIPTGYHVLHLGVDDIMLKLIVVQRFQLVFHIQCNTVLHKLIGSLPLFFEKVFFYLAIYFV
jgi:hypothetical protein